MFTVGEEPESISEPESEPESRAEHIRGREIKPQLPLTLARRQGRHVSPVATAPAPTALVSVKVATSTNLLTSLFSTSPATLSDGTEDMLSPVPFTLPVVLVACCSNAGAAAEGRGASAVLVG
jgi:hypothetical protein